MTKSSHETSVILAKAYATPVGVAVLPIKADAEAEAITRAETALASMRAELEAAGWDIEKVAPYPKGNVWSADYQVAKIRYQRFSGVTKWVNATHRPGTPNIVTMPEEMVERFKQNARDFAAAQYDLFVIKLNGKIGEHVTAVLEGNHVWGESFLTVTFADKPKETWKTKQIWNVSKLGKDFQQWPSRKLKVAR